MNHVKNILSTLTHAALITVLVAAIPVAAEAAEGQALVLDMDARVDAVDLKTREISLGSELGLRSTVFVPKNFDIDDISVGDYLVGTYAIAIETDLRAPTAEELADPWEVTKEGVKTGNSGAESVAVRAVVTIVARDKQKGAILVTDSRNMMHFIAGVELEKFADLTEGQKVVVEFTEAVALTLEKSS